MSGTRIGQAFTAGGGGSGGTVTTVSVTTANGVSGAVATPTTTPAITIVLGAISPTSVAATGTVTGSNLSGTNTGDQTNITGNAATVTTNANLTGPVTSVGNATTIANSVNLPVNPTTTTQTSTDNSTKIATTAYVTTGIANAIAGVNPATAVQAATTAASDTSGFTYNNGVSGIGATFTGSVNTAVTIDGYTFTTLGQRLLVKNDTQSPSGAFNGVYYVTQVQTAILAPILTRALDYNSPSDINNTGAIPVVSGTVNASTSWLLTSTVTTVGTDPLTYVQFSIAPSNVVTLTGTQTLTNKRITKRAPAVTQAAAPTINTDVTDVAHITGLAQAITSMTTNLTGTPNEGDMLRIDITDNGTARAITWGAKFESSTVVLPTTTVVSTRLDVGFIWNTVTSAWRVVAVA